MRGKTNLKVLFWMNIGFDTHTTSEHLLNAVIEQLAKSGHCVHVIQMLNGKSRPVLPQNLINLGVSTDGVFHKAPNKSNFVARYLSAINYYFKCRSVLKTHKDSDAVFIQSTNVAGIAVYLAKRYMKNAKITFNVQDIFPYNAMFSGSIKNKGVIFKTLSAIQRYGYEHSDHLITISEDMKETLIDDGVESNKIEVVYNWSYKDDVYDNLDFTPVSHMFNDNYFNIVYAGNIGVMQNVDIIIEAANLMKDDKSAWFHIIGNGVYKEKLENKAKDYGINNISFWPMQKPAIAPLIYSSADVNVIPLGKNIYRTALPSKTATCLACQKPIIFAIGKESIIGRKIQDQTGCIVTESDNPEEIVNAIQDVQAGRIKINTAKMFRENCSKTLNSSLYAKTILGV